MIGRPQVSEAAPYYFTYIRQTVGDDPLALLERQAAETPAFLASIAAGHLAHHLAILRDRYL